MAEKSLATSLKCKRRALNDRHLKTIRRHRAKKPPESVGWGNEALPKHERLEPQSDPSGARRSRREFQVGPSEASMPIQDRLNLWVN